MKNKKLLILLPLLAAGLGLASCGDKPNDPSNPDDPVVDVVHVESITLSESQLTLSVGEDTTLTVNVTPTNASSKSVTWSSDNEAVATVSERGKVSGIAIGTATITATSVDGGKTASCTVTVSGPKYGTAEEPLTVAETKAVAAAELTTAMSVTTDLVYVEGYVMQVTNGATYAGGIYLADSLDAEKANQLYVYSANYNINKGISEIYVNDKVVISGYMQQYNSSKSTTIPVSECTLELTAYNGTYCSILSREFGTSAITVLENNDVTVTGVPATAKNGSTFEFTVVPKSGYQVSAVRINGETATAVLGKDNTYSGTVKGKTTISVESSEEGVTLESKEIVSPATSSNLTEGKNEASALGLDGHFKVEATQGRCSTNVGLYAQIRLYNYYKPTDEADWEATKGSNNKLTFTGVGIIFKSVSVTVTQNAEYFGVFDGNNAAVTGTEGTYKLDGNKFTLANTYTASYADKASAQVYITKIIISYVADTNVVPATSIALDQSTLELTAGKTASLTATVLPENATDIVTWESSDPTVATVDNGSIAALKAGTTTITAKAGSQSATCAITVTEAPVYTNLTGETASTVDDLYDASGKVVPAASAVICGTISKISNSTYGNGQMKLDDTHTIEIYGMYDVTGQTKYGSCEVKPGVGDFVVLKGQYVEYNSAGEIKNAKILQVNGTVFTAPEISSITLPESSEVAVGAELNLGAKLTIAPTGAVGTITWESSDTSKATVDANGKVTGVAAGNVTITAKTGSLTATCAVEVKATVEPYTNKTGQKELAYNELVDTDGKIVLNSSAVVAGFLQEFTSTDYGNTTLKIDDEHTIIIYGIVGNNNVKYNQITANKPVEGDYVVLQGDWTEYKGTMELKNGHPLQIGYEVCVDPVATAITLPATGSVEAESTFNLAAKIGVTPVDATKPTNITWSSSAEAVATVDANGVVTGVAAGEAVITATAGELQASCTFTVSGKPEVSYSNQTGLTAATHDDLFKADGTINNIGTTQVIAGKVTEIANASKGYAYVQVGDDSIYIFKMFDYTGATAYADLTENKPVEGNFVVLRGTWTEYQGTKELSNCKILQINDQVLVPALTGISLPETKSSSVEYNVDLSKELTTAPTGAIAETVTWTTSDETIATVANGVVTPVKDGTVTITATCGTFQATCSVTFTPAVQVTYTNLTGLTEAARSDLMNADGTINNKDTVQVLAGKITEIQSTTYGNATLTVGDYTYVIYGMYDYTGATRYDKITSDKPALGDFVVLQGTWTQYGSKIELKNGKILQVNDKVLLPTLTGITLPETKSVEMGKTLDLSKELTVTPTGAAADITWTTSDATIATVANGIVSPVAPGEVTITATCGEFSDTCVVTVTGKEVKVAPTNLTGETLLAKSEILNADGTEIAGKDKVIGGWIYALSSTSGNGSSIELEDGSLLNIYNLYNCNGTTHYAVMADKPEVGDYVIIKGEMTNYKGTPQIKNAWVLQINDALYQLPDATAIAIDATGTVAVGSTLDISTVVVTPTEAVPTITWETSDATKATVANGIVTGVAAGEVTITAKCGELSSSCVVTVVADLVETSYVVDFSTKKTSQSGYKTEWTYNNQIKIKGAANNNGAWGYIRIGPKKADLDSTAGAYYMTTINPIASAVSSVDIAMDPSGTQCKSTATDYVKVVVYAYSDAAMTKQVGVSAETTLPAIAKAGQPQTVSVSCATGTFAAGSYYKIVLIIGNSTTTNGVAAISSVTFNYASDEQPDEHNYVDGFCADCGEIDPSLKFYLEVASGNKVYMVVYDDYGAIIRLPVDGSVNTESVAIKAIMQNVASLDVEGTKSHETSVNTGFGDKTVNLQTWLSNAYSFDGATLNISIDGNELTYTFAATDANNGIVASTDTEAARTAWQALTSHVTTSTQAEDDSFIEIANGSYLKIGTEYLRFEDGYVGNLKLDDFSNLSGLEDAIRAAVTLDTCADQGGTITACIKAGTKLAVGQTVAELEDDYMIVISLDADEMDPLNGSLTALRDTTGSYEMVKELVSLFNNLIGVVDASGNVTIQMYVAE